jgi:hypothetical protein
MKLNIVRSLTVAVRKTRLYRTATVRERTMVRASL